MSGEYRPIEGHQPVTTSVHPYRLSWMYPPDARLCWGPLGKTRLTRRPSCEGRLRPGQPTRASSPGKTMFIDESEAADELQRLTRELENFQDIAQQLVPLPGEVPTLEGFDIWGGSLQVSGTV